jgi:hypothetical protein
MEKYKSKFKEKQEIKEDYKTVFQGTQIEIKNVDRAYGRLVADEVVNFIKHKLEDNTNLKVYKINIEVV